MSVIYSVCSLVVPTLEEAILTSATQPPPFSLLAGEILILSAGFVLFSTVVFLGDLEIYFLVPISGHCGSRQDG